jgi:NAD+--asparagine ADP-ribosyltransferase
MIRKYRKDNNLTWHEENNLRTMVLVDRNIDTKFGHVGGTGEAGRKAGGYDPQERYSSKCP